MTQGRWSRSAKRKLKESAAGRQKDTHIKYIKLSKPGKIYITEKLRRFFAFSSKRPLLLS